MPRTKTLIYCEDDGGAPLLDWFDTIPDQARAKCVARIERLSELGHELRRPEADFLRDGIYELRAALQGINYRVLYFFHGREAVILSHGLVKERIVLPKEIEWAITRKRKFEAAPQKHTYGEFET